MEKAEWTDNLIQLQLWTRLVYLAHQVQDHQVVASCAQKALEFAEVGTQSSMKKDQYVHYCANKNYINAYFSSK